MKLREHDRGVSTVIGTLTLFAFVVIALSAYQATAVPSQNAEVEYTHSQDVADQMVGLRSAIVNTISTGTTYSQRISLGTTYPARIVGVNPAPASGTIQTESLGRYRLRDGGLEPNTVGKTCRSEPTTAAVTYQPSYSSYASAPTITYENSVVSRQFTDASRIDASQMLITGKTIHLGPLSGQLSTGSSQTEGLSMFGGQEGTTTITPSNPFTLRVPTQLPAAKWRTHNQLFNLDETPDSETAIKSVTQNGSAAIDVELEAGNYTLVCRPVSMNTAPPAQSPPNVMISRATHEENTTATPSHYDVAVTFAATDEEPFESAAYTVTIYESSAKGTELEQQSGAYTGGSMTISYQTDPEDQNSDPPYYIVVEVSNYGQTGQESQQTDQA